MSKRKNWQYIAKRLARSIMYFQNNMRANLSDSAIQLAIRTLQEGKKK
jgi:hypothetical protein